MFLPLYFYLLRILGVHRSSEYRSVERYRWSGHPTPGRSQPKPTRNMHTIAYQGARNSSSFLDLSDYRLDGRHRRVVSSRPARAHASSPTAKPEDSRDPVHAADRTAVRSASGVLSGLGGLRHYFQRFTQASAPAGPARRYGGSVHEDLCPRLDNWRDQPAQDNGARAGRDDAARMLRPANSGLRQDHRGIVVPVRIF
jgi:hypothetical protein